jgi:uroporphyrinogen III methyltransferase / synthase
VTERKIGKVYIIGAGPGDPGLITVKGARCIGEADVVVYDYLVSEELLRHCNPKARLVYAGKRGGEHTLPQAQINALLCKEAESGSTVARLKGGDPFIFGRGGEEAEVLARAGIPFEIVPGVTSAVAVPAYAGIPLTHREYTSTVAFVTGHEDPGKEQSEIDWAKLAGMGTIVFLMGVKNLPMIVENLVHAGRPAGTPAALIRWGTTPAQETLAGTLGDIVEGAQAHGFFPPAILVVGGVVDLRRELNWYETKPLFGKGVVITRPEEQQEELARLLAAQGARAISFPTIAVEAPHNWRELDAALGSLEKYAWIIFTSANGVAFFFRRLFELGRDVRDVKGLRICTIGPATASAVESRGVRVDLVPDEFISEGVVRAFEGLCVAGMKILLPRAAEARDVIPDGLRAMGAEVDVVTAYRTVNSGRRKEELDEYLQAGQVHVVTFTSPSTVKNFIAIMGGTRLPPEVRIACIGPVTAAAAREAGLRIDVLQERYTMEGLVEGLVRHFAREP